MSQNAAKPRALCVECVCAKWQLDYQHRCCQHCHLQRQHKKTKEKKNCATTSAFGEFQRNSGEISAPARETRWNGTLLISVTTNMIEDFERSRTSLVETSTRAWEIRWVGGVLIGKLEGQKGKQLRPSWGHCNCWALNLKTLWPTVR